MTEWQADTNPAHTLATALQAVLELLRQQPGATYGVMEIQAELARSGGWGTDLIRVATMYAIDTDRLVLGDDWLVRIKVKGPAPEEVPF